jgi:oligopeptide transport system substrate-binding protein
LSQAESDFTLRLGYSAFYPLPDVAYDDIDAFGQNPIGNGMYKFSGDDAWQHDVRIDLVKNEDYPGAQTVDNGGISFIIYESFDAAYSDLLANNLDILDTLPDSAFGTYESDLGDRAINQAAAIIQTITIPSRLAHFSGEEGALRRQAISMAIDRDSITTTILEGTRTPASDFTTPVIDGWSDSLTGSEVLTYDPEKAAALWAQADAISPWDGTFKIGYNADGGHQAWVDAVANSIKNTLSIEAQGAPAATFAEIRSAITDRTIDYAFRSGWQGDYPSLFNFLGPLYATGAGSNDGDYSSAPFDKLLSQGLSAASVDEANGYFEQAQEILLQDLPVIPLWYQNAVAGHAETVGNVVVNWKSVPVYNEVTKTS